MNLSELIDTHRGARTYAELSRDCGGRPSDKRLQQMVRKPMHAFPDPDTITRLAHGLRVRPTVVVMATAESLGIEVGTSTPRLVELLPARAKNLTEVQAAAIAHLVDVMAPDEPVERDVDAELIAWVKKQRRDETEPTVREVLDAISKADIVWSPIEHPEAARRGHSEGRRMSEESLDMEGA